MLTAMMAEYHRKAYNFYQSVVDNDKGKYAVCRGMFFYNGSLLPDYSTAVMVDSLLDAENHAKNLRKLFGVCYVVVQV